MNPLAITAWGNATHALNLVIFRLEAGVTHFPNLHIAITACQTLPTLVRDDKNSVALNLISIFEEAHQSGVLSSDKVPLIRDFLVQMNKALKIRKVHSNMKD